VLQVQLDRGLAAIFDGPRHLLHERGEAQPPGMARHTPDLEVGFGPVREIGNVILIDGLDFGREDPA